MPLNVVLYFEPYWRVLFVISIDILNESVSCGYCVAGPPSSLVFWPTKGFVPELLPYTTFQLEESPHKVTSEDSEKARLFVSLPLIFSKAANNQFK